MAFDYRVTIYSPNYATVLCSDAVSAGDLNGGAIQYEDTPSGCGGGKLSLGLTYEQLISRGYYRGMNIVEISSGDNTLKTSAAGGANKYYLTEGTWGFDPANGEDGQYAYFYDGVRLTMACRVTGIGSDSGGAYITTVGPQAGGAIPALAAGSIVGRRRYCGRIIRRSIKVGRQPGGIDVQLQGLSVAFTQAYGTFTISPAAAVDVGTVIYNSLAQFTSSHWPFFATFTSTDFPTTGSTYHGTLTNVGCDQLISNALEAITSADQWVVRVGHDRKPRLLQLFTESSNTYTYNVSLAQGSTEFEPTSIEFEDEDSSGIFNSILITGDTDPTTGQPAAAIVQDPAAETLVGFQIDGSPISNAGIKDATGAASYGLGQVDQFALPVAKQKALIYTINDTVTGPTPGGMTSGDMVRAVANLTILGFDQSGLVPNWSVDSGIEYGVSTTSLWSTSGSPSVVAGGSPDGFNSWSIPAAGGGTAQCVAAPCTPGQKWTFTGYIDASVASGGSGVYQWVLVNVTNNTTIATVTKASGLGTPTPVSATIPAGCTSIALRAYVQAHSGATGSVFFAQPNLNLSSTIVPYVPNLAAPNVNGLPTSCVTSIDFDKHDAQQEIAFNPIEPDFQAFISEGLNAASTQLRTNIAKLEAIDQYCVSTEARGYTYSSTSLVVDFPAFLAQFAPSTTLVSIAAQNVTMTASATNWVWLQSTGTYQVYQTATPLSGAICIGIFQANATGVMGATFKASVGVFRIGVGNVNAASNLPAPVVSSATVANGNSLNGLAADITSTVTMTNVPTTGAAFGVEWYFRQTGGSGAWIPYEGQNLAIASGSLYPTNPQTVNFEYGDMTNGVQYDLGIGYTGFGGYGPVTVFQSAWTAKTIAIGAPYLYAGSTPTPVVSSPTATNGTSGNGVSADVNVAFTTTNQPTDTSLSRVAIWVRVTALGGSNTIGASGFAWSPYGSQPAGGVGSATPGASYTYSFSLADLTNGQTYDFGITYENNQGGESIVGVVISSFVAQALNLPTTAQAIMPSGIATAGPNITAAAYGAFIAAGSGAVGVPITFSIGDWAANAQPGWFAGFNFFWRIHGSSAAHHCGVLPVTGVVSGLTISLLVPSASTIDIGIDYEGAQSTQSAINWTAYLASIATPAISPPATIAGTDQANVVPDGQLAHVLSAANEAYWYEYLIDGVSFYAVANGDSTTYGLFVWTSGSNGSGRYANSQPFNLVGGTTYTMSAYIDLINATGTGGVRVIGPVSGTVNNTNPANAATAVASVLKAGGASGKFFTAFTPTTSGKYVFQCSNNGITVGGSPIFMGQFQVELGSAFTGFKPNTPAQTQGTDTGTTAHAAASQPTQATITSTAGAEGSFLAAATVARRHVAGNTTFNFLFNPTAALNTQGWATYDTTGHAAFGRDANWGGRFIITCPSGTLSSNIAYWYQTVTVVASTTYTASGNYYCNSIPSGGTINVDVRAGGSIIASATGLTAVSGTIFPFSFTFTTGASVTSVQFELTINTGSTSPSSSTSCAFSSLKLEYGSVSTPHSDETTTAVVTATHAPTAGADGSYLLPAVVAGRHLVGASSTDTAAVADSSGRIIFTRHAAPVQATHLAAPAADGLYLNTGQIVRRHIVGGTGSNLVQNPTGRNGFHGWTTTDDTTHATFAYDSYLGGRFEVSVPAGSNAGPDAYLVSSAIPVFGGFTYTLSGLVECDSHNTGGYAILDCYDNLGTTNYYYCATVTTGGQNAVSVTFVTNASATNLHVRLRIYAGSNSPTVATTAFFYGTKLEAGSVATPFHDDTSAALAATSHDTTAGGEGSFLSAGQISARHLYGGNASDAGAMVDSNSAVLYTRHAPQVQQTINATFSCYGQLPYISAGPVINFPSGLIVFRSTGGFCRLAAGYSNNFSASSTSGFGAFYITWVNNGTASAFGFIDYQNASYQSIVTNPAYQVIGYCQNDSGYQFMANWIHGQHFSAVQGAIDVNGHLIGSTPLYNQLSINAYSTATISVTTSTNSSNVATVVASWPAFTIHRADGSTISVPAGNTPTQPAVGNTRYYPYLWWSPTASASYSYVATGSVGYMMYEYPTSAQAIATSGYLQAMQADGALTITEGLYFTTPVAPGSGSTGGGGNAPPPTCPAAWQEVETLERGFIRADELEIGMHVRDSEDGWNEIYALEPTRSTIVDVTAGDETLSVDVDHQWLDVFGDPDARSNDWIKTQDLTLNTLVSGRLDGQEIAVPILSLRSRGEGTYIRIRCARNRLMLGRTVAHNFYTS